MRPRVKRWFVGSLTVRRFLESVMFIYGSLCVMGCLLPDRLLYLPHAPGYSAESVLHLLTASGASIAARYSPREGARFVVLYSHGNGEDIGDTDAIVARAHAAGASILVYDYEGYGRSSGKPSEARLYADIEAAYDYLTATLHIAPEDIIVHGRSLGGGPSVELATKKPVGGLILESTFMSAFRVPFGVKLLPWDQFDSLAKMPRVACPVLVIHGTADELIPEKHGRALFAAAKGPRQALWVAGAGHNDLAFVAGDSYVAGLRSFFELVSATSASR